MRLHLLAALAAALTLASCGGSDAGPAGSTTSDADRDAARVRLQECLREQGVEVGQGQPPQAGSEKFQEAMEACQEYRRDAFGDLDDADRQELQDQLTELTQCLRDQGLDVPDVQLGQGAGGAGRGLDRDDPDVQAAMQACRDEIPEGIGGRGR
jgi:hypothetical protein